MNTNTSYQMWITGNAESEKLLIPVLPEKFTVSIGSKNTSVDVTGLGEITIKQSRPAYQFSFSSFFPVNTFPGIENISITPPSSCVERIKGWIESDKPVHVIITGGIGVNEYCTIEKFNYYEEGGDVGTIHYDLTLKEYKEVTLRQVTVEGDTASVQQTETRVDNTTAPKTYTIKSGDCLWNIAKSIYGDGADYTKLYEANKDVVGDNPNKIYPGQVLSIPE
ncbi:MAG: LysM peptidoglycan-binding domain-containing protein [Oscillospiraceae bacterium]|nr:LysM peptidoglycan-binding domain-containing protein [Oscillospiraceae bacterium]